MSQGECYLSKFSTRKITEASKLASFFGYSNDVKKQCYLSIYPAYIQLFRKYDTAHNVLFSTLCSQFWSSKVRCQSKDR